MAPMREAHGTGVCQPAEERREERLDSRLGEDTPREDDQDARRELEQGEEHPNRDGRRRVERGARGYGGEEVRVEGGHALGVPEASSYAEDDGHNRNGIFEAGAIVNGGRVLVDKQEADKRHSQWRCEDTA